MKTGSRKNEYGVDKNSSGGGGKGIKFAARTRVLCVVLVSFLMLGGAFSRDVIAAISPQIRKLFGLTHAQYGTIASLQGLPNVVLAFATGAMVDVVGYRKSALYFTAMVTIGTFLVLMAAVTKTVWMLVVGQLTIGIGKQVVSVAQKVAYPHLATSEHIAMSLGLNLAFNRVGSSLGWSVSPFLIDEETGHCAPALALSFGLCAGSFVCALCLFFLTRGEKSLEDKPERLELQPTGRKKLKSEQISAGESLRIAIKSSASALAGSSPDPGAKRDDGDSGSGGGKREREGRVKVGGNLAKRSGSPARRGVSPESSRLPSRATSASAPTPFSPETSLKGTESSTKCGWLRDLFTGISRFSSAFWVLTATMVMFYSCYLPFKVVALEFLMEDRDLSETSADEYIAIIALVPILGCLATGAIIGTRGLLSEALVFGMMVNLVSVICLHTLPGKELIGVILLGVADSLVCTAGWTLVPQSVHPRRRGLAVGLVHAIENSWDVPLNSIFGWMRDTTGNHDLTFKCMMCLAAAGVGFSTMFSGRWAALQAHKS